MNGEDARSGNEPVPTTPGSASGYRGLSQQEVDSRREQYGWNDIPEEKKNPFRKFIGYFWGPIPWMIEAAALLSAAIAHWEDFSIILFLLIVNAIVGFLQERKAENAIELLKKRLAPNARVLRDGTWRVIPARDLVPGDTVHVRLGDIVPADLRIAEGGYLLLDQSALTGESLPVDKKGGDTAFSGSIIRQGETDAEVTSTGLSTLFGKTTRLLQQKPPRSHFQKAIVRIGNFLILLAVALVGLVYAVGLIRSEPVLETLQFALILIVAAIPAALPAVLTVSLAVGAVALAKKEAIVSRLTAIEEMAGMDLLCSDKTGTITSNSISVAAVEPMAGVDEREVFIAAAFASIATSGDPIDTAVISKAGSGPSGFMVTAFTPFDPVSKYSKASVQGPDGRVFGNAKGAPQAIAGLCGLAGQEQRQVEATVLSFAQKGYRALGVGRSDPGSPWRYLGTIGLFDPPRVDSAATLSRAKDLGITVKMVTGDHVAIAREIAGSVGLGQAMVTQGEFIPGEGPDALAQLETADGFAEVFPDAKYHIVNVLQAGGHIVGMTGDGVNDAPALRAADAGIAVAGSTDAAKSAADIVLVRPGLSAIIDAIEQSRIIFRRMESYAVYRIAETVRVLLFLAACILLLSFYPVTAVMIVVLAIINDIPIMMIAYDNAEIAPRPVRWQMNRVISLATILGILGVVESFILLWILRTYLDLPPGVIQTLIFLKLAVAGHMTIYLARTGQHHFWERPLPAPILFFTTELTQVLATILAIYGIFMTAVGVLPALMIWGYAIGCFLVNDIIKVVLFKKIHPYTELPTRTVAGS